MDRVERDEQHRYFLVAPDGSRVEGLSVTRTIVAAGLVDDSHFSDRVRGRGKLAHTFCERIVTNTLSDPIPDEMLGYLVGLRKFLDKHGPTVRAAETMAFNRDRRLAGQIDLDVEMMGSLATVEFKLSEPTAWHGLQTAPYSYLLSGSQWMSRARFGLHLRANGTFRLFEHDRRDDLDVFFRAFDLLRWRCTHGSFERPYGKREGENNDHGNAGFDGAEILDADAGWPGARGGDQEW